MPQTHGHKIETSPGSVGTGSNVVVCHYTMVHTAQRDGRRQRVRSDRRDRIGHRSRLLVRQRAMQNAADAATIALAVNRGANYATVLSSGRSQPRGGASFATSAERWTLPNLPEGR